MRIEQRPLPITHPDVSPARAEIMNKATKSILSERISSNGGARASGKIRCGTKVLTKAAKQNPDALRIYNDGVKQRRKASDIEAEIKKRTEIAHPMYPTNTQHFNVSASDFVLPIFADKIIEVYGEGEGADRKLYKFPVMFHSDHLNDFFPHAFESHQGKDKFRSNFDGNGVRVCEILRAPEAKAVVQQRQQGVKRVPRREWEVRSTCEPRVCKEFLSGMCQFRGRLQFYMPKISGLGLLEMQTASEYAAANIWSTLDQIREALGYIPRHNPKVPGQPVFWLSKVQEERTYFDESGEKRTGLQWVPKLTADIDMGTLLALAHNPSGAPTVPKAWLAAPVEAGESSPTERGASVTEENNDEVKVHPLRIKLETALDGIGCDKVLFCRYAAVRFGNEWQSNESALQTALEAAMSLEKYGKSVDVYVRARMLPIDFQIDQDLFEAYASATLGAWAKNFPKMRQLVKAVTSLFANGRDEGIAAIQKGCQAVGKEKFV